MLELIEVLRTYSALVSGVRSFEMRGSKFGIVPVNVILVCPFHQLQTVHSYLNMREKNHRGRGRGLQRWRWESDGVSNGVALRVMLNGWSRVRWPGSGGLIQHESTCKLMFKSGLTHWSDDICTSLCT